MKTGTASLENFWEVNSSWSFDKLALDTFNLQYKRNTVYRSFCNLINTIKKHDVELVVMAGWMKIMSSKFVNAFKNKIINIHPSLLPSFKGSNAIKEAIRNDSKITGCSVHFVEAEVDSGSLIMQAALSISDKDDLETITKKIHLLEHKILPLSISQAGYIIPVSYTHLRAPRD